MRYHGPGLRGRQLDVLSLHHIPSGVALAALSLLALPLIPGAAVAQDATNPALARSLFEDGIAHTEAAEWEEAADRFERSLALHPSAVVSFNAGIALVHLGRLVEARERFRAAASSDNAQLTTAARAQIEEITPRIGRLEVHLEGAVPEDARVLLDGTALPPQALGVSIPVNPTSHTVTVVSGERALSERSVTIEDGGSERVTLTLVPTPEDVATGTELPPPAGHEVLDEGDDTLLIVTLTGAGVIVVTIIAVVLVLAFSGNFPPIAGNLEPGYVELGR